MEITRLSSKGQIIIPQVIRESHHWLPGLEFSVTDTKQGILLTPLKPFKPTSIQDVIGCVGYKRAKKSLKEMEAGIKKGVGKHK